MIERYVIGLVLMAVPIALLVRHMHKMRAEEKARSRAPFTEKLLRPPGESLRLQIDEIQDKMLDVVSILMCLVVLPGFLIMQIPLASSSGKLVAYLTLPAICYAFAVLKWRKLSSLRNDLRNHRLGFDGERYIANELEPLIAQGYRVFHDFVFEGKPGGEATTFNIDHIAIGPAGVFSIETKTRRKKNETSNLRITVNGDTLEFSTGARDRDSIPQARRAAKDLSNWLTPKGSPSIEVKAILVIPGWSINGMGKGEVPVYSGKNVASYIGRLQTATPLSSQQIATLANQIENHCRNIDSE